MEDDSFIYRNTEFVHPSNFFPSSLLRKANAYHNYFPITEKDSERTPLELEFDFEDAMEGNDPKQCKEVGQIVNWTMANSYVCGENDVMTEEKKRAINGTLRNVAAQYKKLIRVKHKDLNVYSVQSIYAAYTPRKLSSKADHYVYILIRPFATLTIGASSPVAADGVTGRITQSQIFLDPKYLPTEEENINTKERYYFNVIFHEIMHSLGMLFEYMPSWVDRYTGKAYESSPIEIFRRAGYNKSFVQLCSPKCKEVAQRRLNRTVDKNGHKICLELEDNGGIGTAFSHPKATIYRQDVMVGVAHYDSVISEITCAIIEDMGWYTVNWSYAEPMTWGAPELLSKEDLSSFVEKPVWNNIPHKYLDYSNNSLFVGHDYRGYGSHVLLEYNSNLDENAIGSLGDLYISNYSRIINPNIIYDFTPLKSNKKLCGNAQWAVAYYNESEISAMCVKSSIKGNLFIYEYNGSLITCENNTANHTFNENITILCPDAEEIKRVTDFLSQQPHDYGHVALVGDRGILAIMASYGIILVLIIILFLLIVLLISTCCVMCFCQQYVQNCCKRKTNEESDDQELKGDGINNDDVLIRIE